MGDVLRKRTMVSRGTVRAVKKRLRYTDIYFLDDKIIPLINQLYCKIMFFHISLVAGAVMRSYSCYKWKKKKKFTPFVIDVDEYIRIFPTQLEYYAYY